MESSQSKVTLLLDVGADYQRSTAGEDLAQLKRCSHKFIKTHADERYKILRSTELATWRHGIRDVLQLNITEDDLAPPCHTAQVLDWDSSQLTTEIVH